MSKEFKDIKQKDADEIVQLIKSLSGAKSVMLIMGEGTVPCEVHKEFGSCDGKHLTHFASDGIDPDHIPSVLMETAKAFNKHNPTLSIL